MKYFVVLGLAISLLGCGSDSKRRDQSQLSDKGGNLDIESVDLTGTWASFQETRVIKVSTGEYLYSYFLRNRFVLEETDRGVKYSDCPLYGSSGTPYGVKTSQSFYMRPGDPLDTGFQALDEDTLRKVLVYQEERKPDFRYESTQTLRKISDGVSLDSGTLVYNGSVSFSEYNHTCVSLGYSSIGDRKYLSFIVPYGDGSIRVDFRLTGDVVPGDYYYDQDSDPEEVDFFISSSASDATDVAGLNTREAEETTVSVIEFNEDRFSGTFSILDDNDETHTGEFEMIFDR